MNRQVLLLEDDPTIRRMVTTLLSIKGYEVDGVERGDEALRQIAVCSYGVIIVDLMVPAYSGTDVIAAVRVLYPDLLDRMIIMTGFPSQVREAPALGSEILVIEKPVDVDLLLAAVDDRAARSANTVSLESLAMRRAGLARLFAEDCVAIGATAGLLTRVRDSHLHLEAAFGYDSPLLDPYFPLPLDAVIPIAVSVRERRPLFYSTILDAAREYPNLIPVWNATHSQSLASVPLSLAEVPVGVIGWSWRDRQEFDAARRKRLAALSKRYELLISAANFSEDHQACERHAASGRTG